jgi:hypothetical protein
MQDINGTKALYKSTQMKLDRECGFTPADRFHSVLAADGIAGLIMAKRAGLITYDIGPVVKWLISAVAAIKDQIKSMDVDAETTLTNYLAENYNNVLRIKSTQDVRAANGKGDLDHLVIPDATPRISLLARYEYDIKMLYVYPAPLKTWCTKQQINYEGFIDSLKRGRTKAKMDKKRMSKGTHMNLPSASVLWIHCEGFMDDDKEEQIAAAAAHKAALEGDEEGPSLS